MSEGLEKTLFRRGWKKVSAKVFGFLPNDQLTNFVHVDTIAQQKKPPDAYLEEIESYYK